MANVVHVQMIRDGTFRDKANGFHPTFDFSGEAIAYDFSGMRLEDCNFQGCNLHGSSFRKAHLERCSFADSNWSGVDFFEATLNGGNFKHVVNADLAVNLTTAKAYGFETEFETAKPSSLFGLNADWEMLGKFGRLPLFGVSTTALVLLPVYFYFLAHYNRTLEAAKEAFPVADTPLAMVVSKLPLAEIPALSLATLFAALTLALASAIYAFFCPALPKEFSLTQWRFQLEKSPLVYKAQAWMHRPLRAICFLLYVLGGVVGAVVLSFKLYNATLYILGIA